MEKHIKIYLIERDFKGAELVIMGRAVGEFARHNLYGAQIIEFEREVDYNQDDFVAVIYNDTPLCDNEFIREKCEQMRKHSIAKCFIGNGFIVDKHNSLGDNITATEEKALKVTSMGDIARVFAYLKYSTCQKWLDANVLIMDASTTYIEPTVVIGKGSIVYPNNWIQGNTIIGEGVVIYPYSNLVDTSISDASKVRSSFCVGAFVGKNCTIGPFACLRNGTHIGDNCRIGDYVEVKNSTLADNVKAAHLAYIGDSFVGPGTNVGCGAVFCNFDGKQKRGVQVGSNVFIGANANLVAPLTIGDGAFVAAGSTVTKDVPENSLCIARSKEVVKAEYNFRTP